MKLEFLQVTIKPWTYRDTQIKELKITIQANGKQFHLREPLEPVEDFESAFDKIMDYAGEKIKEIVRQHKEEEMIAQATRILSEAMQNSEDSEDSEDDDTTRNSWINPPFFLEFIKALEDMELVALLKEARAAGDQEAIRNILTELGERPSIQTS